MQHIKPSDTPYKVMYQDPGLLEDTVRLVAPELADAYDFKTAVALDTEHLGATNRTRLQDKAYLVEPKDPSRPRLLVVLEFQSDQDSNMALRMEEYAYLAATSAPPDTRPDTPKDVANRPPEVLPLVIYNGEHPWRVSAEGIVRRIGDEPPMRGPAYDTVDLPRLAKEPDERGRQPHLGSRVATLAGVEAASVEHLPTLLAEAFQDHQDAESSKLRRGLHLRVGAMLWRQGLDGKLPPLEECERLLAEGRGEAMRTMMDAQFERWRDENVATGLAQGIARGRAQGMEQGKAQGRVALLEQLAEERFGAGVAGRMAALLADISDTSRLDAAGKWLVACDSGETLLERLPAIVRGTGNGAPG